MISPLADATHGFTTAGDGKLCIKGTAAKVVGMDYAKYFGAAMGVDLCQASSTDPSPTMKYTLGTCPQGLTKLTGLRFQVTGAKIPSTLRAAFNEPGAAFRLTFR